MRAEQHLVFDLRIDDAWPSDAETGLAAIWSFAGRSGLDRLSGPAVCTSPEPDRFHARLTRVQLDHVALEVFQASPLRLQRTERQLRTHPTALISLLVLLEGRLEVQQRGERYEVVPGEHVVIDSREPSTVTGVSETRVFRSVIGVGHFPKALEAVGATPAGPHPPTPLTESFQAFAASVLRRSVSGPPAKGERLVRAVADLQAAVLAEAQRSARRPVGTAGLRVRMEQYIEANHDDVDLTPATLAAAFDVSLRQAHAVFDDEERTIARFIRQRRVAAVAGELRADGEAGPLTHLARRHGFSSLDALGRAFRQRYGMTPSEYREGGHRRIG